ncbi:MAG: hypothetical protein V1801_02995 [Candidatus Falkowbacteria bacterium]
MNMKIKKLFFVFLFVFILIPTTSVLAGSLYGPSLQGIAYEQGWLKDHVGGTCKYREPSNAEIQELKKYCKDITICLNDVENLIKFNSCSTYGNVVGVKDNNVIFEQKIIQMMIK